MRVDPLAEPARGVGWGSHVGRRASCTPAVIVQLHVIQKEREKRRVCSRGSERGAGEVATCPR